MALDTDLSLSPATLEVLALFEEVSKLRSPSLKESPVRELLVTDVKKVHGATFATDKIGNLVVVLPGTGHFARRTEPEIALQIHMDMVEAVKGSPTGSDLSPYFKSGISFQVSQESSDESNSSEYWVHSVGRQTTIGADPRLPLSVLRRLIVNQNIKHPPLELIFTVDEEIGFSGAKGFSLPIRSPRMINVDGEDLSELVLASIGRSDVVGTKEFENDALEKVTEGSLIFEANLMNLRGGHSGLAIDDHRANAFNIAANLLKKLGSACESVKLLDLRVGELMGGGQIPSGFSIQFSCGRLSTSKIKRIVEASINEDLSSFPHETEVQFSIENYIANGSEVALKEGSLTEVISVFEKLLPLQGVLDRYHDGGLRDSGVTTFTYLTDFEGKKRLNLRYENRSFEKQRLKGNHDRTLGIFRSMGLETRTKTFVEPFEPGRNSNLLKTISTRYGHQIKFRTARLPGTLEASLFLEKFPNLDIFIWGFTLRDPHTPDESFNLRDLDMSVRILFDYLSNPSY